MGKKDRKAAGTGEGEVSDTTKQERDVCPLCGNELYDTPSGIWCLNPDCVVLDDADNYR